MTSVNLTPITKEEQPTSHVTVGESKVGPSAEIARVRHAGREAFFRVDTEDDGFASTIKNKVYLNSNVATLFGGINRTNDFYVDTDVSLGSVRTCKRASIYAEGVNEEALASALAERQFLLHPIHEVADIGGERVEFVVDELEPRGTTLRVDDDTEFEFLDEPPASTGPPAGADAGAGGGGDGSAGGGRGGAGGQADEEEANIDITPKNPTTSFEEDVAGLEEVKQTAEMMLSLFEPDVRDEVVERYGEEFADRGGGMMLYGPPGCGKTLVSEAIAYEAKHNTDIEDSYGEVVFLEVRGSDVVSKYSGESEKNVRAAFEQAHEAAGDGFAVLFFDEVETLIPDRSDDNLQRHERALTNAFLQEMNDVEDNLLVIGATNMPFSIDPAATRRFPIQQFIPQPDADVMSEVWRTSLGRIGEDLDEEALEELGEASVGYTPAEIADRVLGSELQRELIESVIDGDAITPDKQYLLEKLEESEPKTVRQYVSSTMKQASELEGYPEMKRYLEEQAKQIREENAASADANAAATPDGGAPADDGPDEPGEDTGAE
ncbi:ATP-binding protein [Halobaculum roseum]|uniref:ATP-binding protein n=1 Tax=Halobaculum roseum TaxID=2175149 RepID=A0ABD5MT57_9EURY|nr:AAA family ATPase [Halobaculum roseum]QZY04617.1 AAA family ATPase [Halobaculum roseum]